MSSDVNEPVVNADENSKPEKAPGSKRSGLTISTLNKVIVEIKTNLVN